MSIENIPTPTFPEWVKLYNTYDPEHYMPGKRVSAEEWNTLFLASVRQGNYNADTLELLIKTHLPDTYQTIADFDKFATLLRGDFEAFKAQSEDAYTAFTTQIQKDFTDLSGEVEVFKSRVIHAEDVAFSLDDTIQEANQYAQEAVAIAEESNTVSQNALATADAAVTTSDTALSTAEKADTTSQTALSTSQESVITANTAAAQSTQAVNTANAASLRADDAIATANAAKIESASAKVAADTAAANSTTALSTSQEAKNIASTAEQVAQSALDSVTEGMGSQVLVNGSAVPTFNADTKADVTYVNQKIDDIMGPGSTEAIDTILELADAFKSNSDVIKVLNESISAKANASDVTDMLATKANASDLDNYVTKTGYTMRASSTVGEFYYNTGTGEKAIQLKMPTIPVQSVNGMTGDVVIDLSKYVTSVNGLTGDVVIDTSKYVTSDDLSAVTDATLSDDNKTLTITKRNGTSFNFQGGGSDLSGYVQYADIINNLTSTATNKTLAAYQGKVLNDTISQVQQQLGTLSGNVVTKADNQTISGVKTFTNTFNQEMNVGINTSQFNVSNTTSSNPGIVASFKAPNMPNNTSSIAMMVGRSLRAYDCGFLQFFPTGNSNSRFALSLYGKDEILSADGNGIVKFLNTPKVNGTDVATTAWVQSRFLDKIYPVGSVYMSITNTSPASFLGGTWAALPAGYALWTASSGAGNTIAASLPNIKGTIDINGAEGDISPATGAFTKTTRKDWGAGHASGKIPVVTFNASNYNSIYSDSATTVQPPAYKVYAWRRTA